MATMKEISDRADVIFMEMYSVSDILKGDTIAMHKHAWSIARYELEGGTSGDIDKNILGILLDTTITEIYEIDDEYLELYTEGSLVRTMSLLDIIRLYQKEISRPKIIDIPISGKDIEFFADVILENKVVSRVFPDHARKMTEVRFMTEDECNQRKA